VGVNREIGQVSLRRTLSWARESYNNLHYEATRQDDWCITVITHFYGIVL